MKTTKESNGNRLAVSQPDSVTEIVEHGTIAHTTLLHIAQGQTISAPAFEKMLLDCRSKINNDKVRNGERRPVAEELFRGSVRKGLLHFEGVELSPHLADEHDFLKKAVALGQAYRKLVAKLKS